MAKKIVRGITDVKTINNQDYDTNNVNDLLSDGQYNYIHRKKGENEEYHNLTDNIKTISSDNTELLEVTNNNKTTNTATLHPKHDAQKEQVLESTRDTVNIQHGTNGTAEKTTVDTNPQKVLEHSNLLTDYGISKNTTGNTTKLGLEYTRVDNGFDLNNFLNGRVRGASFLNAPSDNNWYFVETFSEGRYTVQRAVGLDAKNTTYVRRKSNNVWEAWREQVGDKSDIDGLLAQKQDKLTAGEGITIEGQTISATGGAHDSQKEQVIESTRNTVTIHHGTNGKAEKTTVDVNFEKVQEKLTAGSGITIQGNTISATGGGSTSTIYTYNFEGGNIIATQHVVESGYKRLTTFTFLFYPQTSEGVIPTTYKERIEPFIPVGSSISNGAISITNDGTNIKVTNSNSTENVYQHGTFTFNRELNGGGTV